ncbi:hypothetical protein CR513_32634, partial [Mucuna pruriens]
MFTAKYESAKGGQDRERTKVNSTIKTSVKADIAMRAQAEIILARKDQKQARVESISVNQGKNRVSSRSNSSARRSARSDSNPTIAKSIPTKRSRP